MWTRTGLMRGQLEGGKKLFKQGGKQILVIEAEGRLFAIANRCPHEGYPLSEGTLSQGCVLTCNWHNWKFDLATGEALVGGDSARTYAIRMDTGEILIDLADPLAVVVAERALKGLAQAIAEGDATRMARETARLGRAGFDPEDSLRHALHLSHDRFEFGTTHAYAAAADWLALSRRAPDEEHRLAALLEPIGHIAEDIRGEAHHPFEAETESWDAAAFARAAEAEDEARAIALANGALGAGLTYAELRPAFARASLAHYADFGHSAIYVFKTGQLIDRLGPGVALPLLRALVRSIIFATREDKLPEFRCYADALAAWDGKGGTAAQAENFIGQSVKGALNAVLASSGRPPREIYDALLEAAAWNQLHFNTKWEQATDNSVADNIGWLDFTHALTFANAVRHLCEETPELWPSALLQLALFVGRNRKYTNPNLDVSHWSVDDAGEFISRETAALYDHSVPEPIIACHRIKNLFALEDELAASPNAPWRDTVLASVNRYLNTPLK
ncbi:MAG TPA: Rieske 2Fe-2S domain-containing protein, partial [Alphaproteobacteria bacterium]|nr:Rieske 2Fe-2S domain-containing protein [Alphaproteobacteria bacterium]